MSSIPLSALHVNPPQENDTLQKIMAMRGMMNQQALQKQELQKGAVQAQQQQMQMQDQKTLRNLMIKHSGNLDKVIEDAPQAGVSPNTVLGLQQHNVDVKTKAAELVSKQGANALQQADLMQGAHDAVSNAPPEQRASIYQQQYQRLGQQGIDTSQMPQQYPGDEAFKLLGTVVQGHKQQIEDAFKQAETAKNAEQAKNFAATAAKSGPLAPPEIDRMNQQLQSRYQVLNPGQQLPAQFQLSPNAKRQDYEELDKALEQVEKAKGVKSQQDTANAMREQTASLASQNAAERREEKGMTAVVGNDAQGNRVLVSKAEAEKMGLTGVTKADADLQNKSEAARHWLTLANKQAAADAPPEQMGIMQLVDKMDKEGKLGAIASRWNEFLAGKIGAGDPEFAALRAKMGLSATKLMQAHVGSRGGSFMLEHFEDLANAKKMDGATLKAGLGSELNYMQDVAMLPKSVKGQSGGMIRARDPQGKLHEAPAGTALPANWTLEK